MRDKNVFKRLQKVRKIISIYFNITLFLKALSYFHISRRKLVLIEH